jgi:hypothetical protein
MRRAAGASPLLPLLLLLHLQCAAATTISYVAHVPPGLVYLPHHGLSVERWEYRLARDAAELRAVGAAGADRDMLLRAMRVHVPGDELRGGVLTRQAVVGGAGDVVMVNGTRSTFQVTYDVAAPAAARKPFERGLRTWADVLPCDVVIRVYLGWQKVDGGTLAATSSPFFVPGSFAGADRLDDGTLYGPVMAASLQGRDFIGKDEFHVVTVFNADAAWHFGDEDAPFDRWDFATTSLHETTHGVFFSGVVDVDAGARVAFFASGSTIPARFDQFLAASDGSSLAERCIANGTLFYDAVTNGGLVFEDRSARKVTHFGMYAPTLFQQGSSTYHHDPARLASDCEAARIDRKDCSDLMTQKLPNGYTQRALGEPVLRMLTASLGPGSGIGPGGSCDVSTGRASAAESAGGMGTEQVSLPSWAVATIAAIGVVGVAALVLALYSAFWTIRTPPERRPAGRNSGRPNAGRAAATAGGRSGTRSAGRSLERTAGRPTSELAEV